MVKIKKPKIGEYILATKYSDKDPNDPWYVSTITDIWESKDKIVCRVDGSNRWWKHFWRIEKSEGEEWLKNNERG